MNLCLMVFGARYYYYNELYDGFMVLIFPALKAFLLWLNIEFTFRYYKTAQILKTFIHANPFEQIKAQEPAIIRRKRTIDITVLSILTFMLLAGTVFTTVGFTCYQDNNDKKEHQEACQSSILIGQSIIFLLRTLTYVAELWTIWAFF